MSEVHADVAIIGAGAAGLTLASELASRGVDCVVLDQADCEITSVNDYGYGVRIDRLERGERLRVRARYAVACASAAESMHIAGRFRLGRRFMVGAASCAGYDTGVEDAVNLGWKLAAVLQGWGGAALLDTYEAERRPFALRVASYLRALEDGMAALPLPAGEVGGQLRGEADACLRVQLGRAAYIHQLRADCRYESGIVAADDEALPASGAPGVRAPDVHLDDGALCDHFGRDFTLLWLGIKSPAANWHGVADALGIALRIVPCAARRARTLYGADLVLIRPDGHITWRGDGTANAHAVLRLATLKYPPGG